MVVIDTDVVSFRFKKDTRARLYKRHLIGQDALIAFMTLAELHAWALERRWGATRQGECARLLKNARAEFQRPASLTDLGRERVAPRARPNVRRRLNGPRLTVMKTARLAPQIVRAR